MVISTQRTIHWLSILLDMSVGKDFTIIPNTSLNEKFDVNPDLHCNEGEYPRLKYFSIGVGGKNMTDATDAFKFSRHTALHGALFNQIPFALKPLDEDFTPAVQANYRFRKQIIIKEIEYAAYYLKVIPKPELRDFYYEINTINDKSSLGVFNSNTDAILNPIPIDKDIKLANMDKASYISKLIKFFFTLTKNETDELLNVMSVMDLDATHINEIGICSGLDREIDNKMHAINVQTAYIFDTDLFMATDMLNDDKINLNLEIGGSEPMMV